VNYHIENTRSSFFVSAQGKKLVSEWFGTAVALDYGMVTSDASLAEALWRNLYLGNETVPVHDLALMVKYVREQQKRLENMSDEEFLKAEIMFMDPPFEMPDSEKFRKRIIEEESAHKLAKELKLDEEISKKE